MPLLLAAAFDARDAFCAELSALLSVEFESFFEQLFFSAAPFQKMDFCLGSNVPLIEIIGD